MRRKLLRLVPVYVVAILCFIWVFHGIDLRQLRAHLASLSWPFLCLAAILNISVYIANAWRWELALRSVKSVPYTRSLQATYIGVFLNEVLPLRPGEIARCGLLSRWVPGIGFSVAVSSAIIERLTEAGWLVIAFVVLILVAPVPKPLAYGFAIGTFVLVAIAGVLAVLARRNRSEALSGAGKGLIGAWRQFLTGLRVIGRISTLSVIAGCSLLSLFLNVLATWALMETCGIALPIAVAAGVFIIIRIGTSIPTTPGSVGPYQLFSVLALGLFGVNKVAAVTFSVAAFAAVTFPLLIGGAVAFLRAGEDFSEIAALANRATFAKKRTR
jgi:uncharacterized protein (TIRG00374 family)